jgi:PAS domain S-box-containing protein
LEDGAKRHIPLESAITEEGRYRLLVEAVTDYAIYMLDLDGFVASWNAGARRFKGYTEEEILGHHFSDFYTPEDRAAGLPARALAAAVREGRFEGEGWRVRKDGTRFWAHVVIDLIRDRSGSAIGFAKITRDLTERRMAEETLRQSEEQFRLLVQSVTDYSLYMLTVEGRIASWNAGAERIKGYTATEILGSHFSRFYTEEDRATNLPKIALETAAREGRYEKEGWRVRKDGTRFWASVVIDAIRDPMGKLIGYAKITRDITERRDTQIALEKARDALLQSQKMDALGQLTGGIAHDFNNLLTAVLGSLEIARKRVTDGSVVGLIDNAIRGAQRGAALTRRMLTFARRQELDLEPIDIPVLVRGMTELLERSLGPSVIVETRFPSTLPWVTADLNQLEMAILNLAVNARDAMPKGGAIVLTARLETVATDHARLKPGSYVCLSLADTGEGMDEATLARATEPFYTTKDLGKGTGLGLSMAHGLAEQSGGQLVLYSRKNEGTTVELWLPVAPKATITMNGLRSEERAEAVARSMRVVVVDDDNLVLTNLIAMLEDLGHEVFAADSGQEALVLLHREANIDLLITDQAMPKMTGMELMTEVRRGWPNLPLILATGYAEFPGFEAVRPRLAKPFLQHELVRAIDEAMAIADRRKAEGAADA